MIGTEVRRPLSPVERWYWIADQTSPLNDIARVRLTGDMRLVSVTKSSRAFDSIERSGFLAVGISNLGRYEFPTQIGDWNLSGAQFITGVSISGYLITTVNTSHDELFWNFSQIDIAVSPPSAQRFADGCPQTLFGAIA
jgi:hypothetical protein